MWRKVRKWSLVIESDKIFTCRIHYWSVFVWKLEDPKTFHKYDAKLSLGSRVLEDLPSRTNLTVSTQTDYRCDVSRCLVGNRVIQEISGKAHRQFEDEAMMIPKLVHLLQDRIRHRWDLMMVVMCEKDLWQTVDDENRKWENVKKGLLLLHRYQLTIWTISG